jgi:hypothetical protein
MNCVRVRDYTTGETRVHGYIGLNLLPAAAIVHVLAPDGPRTIAVIVGEALRDPRFEAVLFKISTTALVNYDTHGFNQPNGHILRPPSLPANCTSLVLHGRVGCPRDRVPCQGRTKTTRPSDVAGSSRPMERWL